ncbi:MAG: matrixin family metalloprotease [Acidobacteria bacterium]|nr:matrixin family metalloprotease [Acidobacteriota bacterium]
MGGFCEGNCEPIKDLHTIHCLVLSIDRFGLILPGQKGVSFAIQPLGSVVPAYTGIARSAISDAYGNEKIALLSPKPLPESAYYEPRKRCRAEKILEFLYSLKTDEIDKAVGLTSSDISTTKDPYDDWGIFGMAYINGRTCVISTYRLGEGKVDTALFLERLKKVIAHEVGHILGLQHCPTPGCLMQAAQGRIATIDGSEGRLCPRCQGRLGLKDTASSRAARNPSPL